MDLASRGYLRVRQSMSVWCALGRPGRSVRVRRTMAGALRGLPADGVMEEWVAYFAIRSVGRGRLSPPEFIGMVFLLCVKGASGPREGQKSTCFYNSCSTNSLSAHCNADSGHTKRSSLCQSDTSRPIQALII